MERINGIRLRELRKKSKITQAQLAQYLEVDQSMVTKLENGSRNFSLSIIDKICNLFGCTESYLMGESEEYSPICFAFRNDSIQVEDLQSIAAVNRIAMNLRYMNEKMEEQVK